MMALALGNGSKEETFGVANELRVSCIFSTGTYSKKNIFTYILWLGFIWETSPSIEMGTCTFATLGRYCFVEFIINFSDRDPVHCE